MTALRARIDARRAAVVERLRIAEAATPGLWATALVGPAGLFAGGNYIGGMNSDADDLHVATNSPAVVIAECRRELAAIGADLALLDALNERRATNHDVEDALDARYPEVAS